MSSPTVQTSGSSIGFGSLLAIVFIVLKLCHVISWAWIWILAPIWIPLVLVVGFILTVAVLVAFLSKK